MRDYTLFDKYISILQQDVYPQPVDKGHLTWAKSSLKLVPDDVDTVLDVGCGEGFLKDYFEERKIVWSGITIGDDDYTKGREKGRDWLYKKDFTFTDYPHDMFDLVYARHALEHSPFPIITLMEWHRIAIEYLLLVAPAPEYWKYAGANHYSVANEDQLWWWLARAGWEIEERDYLRTDDAEFLEFYLPEEKDRSKAVYPGAPALVEYRYLCRKGVPRTE
jgi:SAM-dependent methyltransferase